MLPNIDSKCHKKKTYIDSEYNSSGDTIPTIDYTPDEHRVWSEVYAKLKSLYPTLACAEYRRNLAAIEREGIFTPNRIPQLHDVSCYLQSLCAINMLPLIGHKSLLLCRNYRISTASMCRSAIGARLSCKSSISRFSGCLRNAYFFKNYKQKAFLSRQHNTCVILHRHIIHPNRISFTSCSDMCQCLPTSSSQRSANRLV